jgi:hypothetical protein
MSEGKESAQNRRRHLNPDELPGRPFDAQGEDGEQVVTSKKKIAEFIASWKPIASQRLSAVRHRLFPRKR